MKPIYSLQYVSVRQQYRDLFQKISLKLGTIIYKNLINTLITYYLTTFIFGYRNKNVQISVFSGLS